MNPLVSIIIPCYNYGRYLAEAIESAIAQTYTPTEIIVVNDGSTDNTIEVASRYPVRLINQPNQGAAKTFNRGIEFAKGQYLVILSADDKLHPSFLEKTVPILMMENSIAFIYTNAFLFGSMHGLMISKKYDVEALRRANYITGTALTRRDAFNVTGGFDPDLDCMEDWDLWLSFAEKGLYGRLLPEPLFYYRQHSVASRNVVPHKIALMAILKIWKKHKVLCPQSFIWRTIAIAGFYRIMRGIIFLIENLSPPTARKKIADLRQRLIYLKGADIVEVTMNHLPKG